MHPLYAWLLGGGGFTLLGLLARISFLLGGLNATLKGIAERVKQLEDNENAVMMAWTNGYDPRGRRH